jgi:hypothetical protein
MYNTYKASHTPVRGVEQSTSKPTSSRGYPDGIVPVDMAALSSNTMYRNSFSSMSL